MLKRGIHTSQSLNDTPMLRFTSKGHATMFIICDYTLQGQTAALEKERIDLLCVSMVSKAAHSSQAATRRGSKEQ